MSYVHTQPSAMRAVRTHRVRGCRPGYVRQSDGSWKKPGYRMGGELQGQDQAVPAQGRRYRVPEMLGWSMTTSRLVAVATYLPGTDAEDWHPQLGRGGRAMVIVLHDVAS